MNALPLSALAFSGQWQEGFLAILPAVITHAQIRFRKQPPDQKEEAITETIAAACVSYAHLAAQGKLGQAFTSSLADFAVRHVVEGRHVGGSQNSTDAMSPLAQKKRKFTVRRLPQRRGYYCAGRNSWSRTSDSRPPMWRASGWISTNGSGGSIIGTAGSSADWPVTRAPRASPIGSAFPRGGCRSCGASTSASWEQFQGTPAN